METELLTKQQIKQIYREHLKNDFPASERRPLRAMLRSMRRGTYTCYGLTEGGELMAYAFFVHTGREYLLDYFAAVEGKRASGYGSVFLGLLREKLQNAEYVLAEVEEPDSAQDEKEKETRTRRIRFYGRAGFADTGVRARTFGVDYRIIGMQTEKPFDKERICELYVALYGKAMPKFLCRREVRPWLPKQVLPEEMAVDGKVE